jgi:glycosyltransferase involved in cell wall biosynthesis
MRIVHLLNHTKRLNGHVHAAVDLACAQVKLGHTVAMASGGGDFDQLLAEHGVECMQVTQERRLLSLSKGLWSLYRLVDEWRADVVHAHMVTSAILAWPVCRVLHRALITTVHNEFQKSAIVMGLGTRVIAVSASVGQSMQKRGISRSRIDVVLNGTIGSVRFEGKDRTARPLKVPAIIFVGGLHPRKGLPDLFAAFDIVHRKIQGAHLYIVGGGPHHDEYVAMVNAMECNEAVTFTGPTDDPFPLMRGADIFVLPSHADPAPLVLSEGREAGCAIVATNVDGIPELLEHGKAGILVPPRDPVQLAKVLCRLLENIDVLEEWKRHSQYNIEYLRIDRVARETLSVYATATRKAVSGSTTSK